MSRANLLVKVVLLNDALQGRGLGKEVVVQSVYVAPKVRGLFE
jgi:hypothetical protein